MHQSTAPTVNMDTVKLFISFCCCSRVGVGGLLPGRISAHNIFVLMTEAFMKHHASWRFLPAKLWERICQASCKPGLPASLILLYQTWICHNTIWQPSSPPSLSAACRFADGIAVIIIDDCHLITCRQQQAAFGCPSSMCLCLSSLLQGFLLVMMTALTSQWPYASAWLLHAQPEAFCLWMLNLRVCKGSPDSIFSYRTVALIWCIH